MRLQLTLVPKERKRSRIHSLGVFMMSSIMLAQLPYDRIGDRLCQVFTAVYPPAHVLHLAQRRQKAKAADEEDKQEKPDRQEHHNPVNYEIQFDLLQ